MHQLYGVAFFFFAAHHNEIWSFSAFVTQSPLLKLKETSAGLFGMEDSVPWLKYAKQRFQPQKKAPKGHSLPSEAVLQHANDQFTAFGHRFTSYVIMIACWQVGTIALRWLILINSVCMA